MIGAIIGDMVGSVYEFDNIKTTEFELITPDNNYTDDSVMTFAVADWLLNDKNHTSEVLTDTFVWFAHNYPCPLGGYGGGFLHWLTYPETECVNVVREDGSVRHVIKEIRKPYNSWGNGSAMRVSGCIYAAKTLEEVKLLSRLVTEVTHNHEEGIKGAEATAVAGWMALHGSSKDEIRDCIARDYYALDFTLDSIRDTYRFNESCQNTVPQAIEAFLESESFEDAIRCAISIGGDSDTLGAITGGIAEAYWGVPDALRGKAITYLDERLLGILERFEAKWPGRRA